MTPTTAQAPAASAVVSVEAPEVAALEAAASAAVTAAVASVAAAATAAALAEDKNKQKGNGFGRSLLPSPVPPAGDNLRPSGEGARRADEGSEAQLSSRPQATGSLEKEA
jgi:hypothetical protein